MWQVNRAHESKGHLEVMAALGSTVVYLEVKYLFLRELIFAVFFQTLLQQ